MNKKGFTLIEVLIASGIFALVSLTGAATLTGIFKAERQAQVKRSDQQAVRYTLETVSRDIRLADNIEVFPAQSKIIVNYAKEDPNKCRSIYLNSNQQIVATDYVVNCGSAVASPVTAEDASIEEFYVQSNSTNSLVFIYIRSRSLLDPDAVPLEASTLVVPRGYRADV